jgi:hypothetical protein
MTTMVFSTPYWKSALLKAWPRFLLLVCLAMASAIARAQTQAEVTLLRAERSVNEVFVSANVNFELPAVVEEALLKGVPMFFLLEAELYQDRWYWYDKRIASAQRDVIGRHATTDALTAGHIGAPLTAQRLLYVRQPYGEGSGRDRRGIHIG